MWVIWDLIDYLLYCLTETVFCVIIFNISQGSIFRALISHQQPLNTGTLFYLTHSFISCQLTYRTWLTQQPTDVQVIGERMSCLYSSSTISIGIPLENHEFLRDMFIYLKYISKILIRKDLRIYKLSTDHESKCVT